jgi:hypothetical protein
MFAGDRLQHHEADVVAIAGIGRARIAEPDEEQHARLLWPPFFHEPAAETNPRRAPTKDAFSNAAIASG